MDERQLIEFLKERLRVQIKLDLGLGFRKDYKVELYINTGTKEEPNYELINDSSAISPF